ncbi:hypothetical protein F5880DRAFT_930044 [Lentinula raphanica]|nr:hypothetical protein F5880DRAFT_930044 [Lentinula raphanica]
MMDGNLRQLKRSSEFFLTGGDLHLIVNEYRFRVHSYFFTRESQHFRQRLAISDAFDIQGNGSSMSSAIVLDDYEITAEEFESFLRVFYNPKYYYYDLARPHEEWASILKLSNLWDFPNVKELAIRELEKLEIPLVDRIVLYQDHQVDAELRLPLYVELASREATLDHDESTRLGFRTAIVIFQARERLRSLAAGGKSPLPDELGVEAAKEVICNLFKAVPEFTPPSTPKPRLNGFDSPRRPSGGFGFGVHSRTPSATGKLVIIDSV